MLTRALRPSDVAALRELAEVAEAEGFHFIRRFVEDITAGRVELDGPCEFFLAFVADDHLVAVGGVTPDPYLADSRIGRLRRLRVS